MGFELTLQIKHHQPAEVGVCVCGHVFILEWDADGTELDCKQSFLLHFLADS